MKRLFYKYPVQMFYICMTIFIMSVFLIIDICTFERNFTIITTTDTYEVDNYRYQNRTLEYKIKGESYTIKNVDVKEIIYNGGK